MNIEFPKIEYLLTNRLENFTKEQLRRYKLLTLRESMVNVAAGRFVGLLKDGCQKMYLSEFLDSMYEGIEPYLDGKCSGMLLLDDFIFIASVASKALKNIVAHPSTRLIKVEEHVKYYKVTNTGTKTMQWLAHRPGATIAEKIAPKNKVLTVSTRFTADTKENEASMYLYGVIYSILASRLFKSECKACDNKTCSHKKLFEELENLYALKNVIRRGELGNVPGVRHSIQNNKLMCDTNYKTVWDCNLRISRMESGLRAEWESLDENLYTDLYYCILAIILHCTDVKLYDVAGRINFADDGKVTFSNAEEVTFVINRLNFLQEIEVFLQGHAIQIKTTDYTLNGSEFKVDDIKESCFDLTPCIDALNNGIAESEEVAKSTEERTEQIKEQEEQLNEKPVIKIKNVRTKRKGKKK